MPLDQDPSEEALPTGATYSPEEVEVDSSVLAQAVSRFQARAGGVGVPSAPPREHKFSRRPNAARPAFVGGTTTGPRAPRLGA